MKSKYRKIEFGFGDIESAMKELKSHKDLVCGLFNGEFDEVQQKRHEKYLEDVQKNCNHSWVYKITFDHNGVNVCEKCKLVAAQ